MEFFDNLEVRKGGEIMSSVKERFGNICNITSMVAFLMFFAVGCVATGKSAKKITIGGDREIQPVIIAPENAPVIFTERHLQSGITIRYGACASDGRSFKFLQFNEVNKLLRGTFDKVVLKLEIFNPTGREIEIEKRYFIDEEVSVEGSNLNWKSQIYRTGTIQDSVFFLGLDLNTGVIGKKSGLVLRISQKETGLEMKTELLVCEIVAVDMDKKSSGIGGSEK